MNEFKIVLLLYLSSPKYTNTIVFLFTAGVGDSGHGHQPYI
jgi:hypothetical protein